MHRKYIAKGKDDALARIERGIRKLGGTRRSLVHQSKDPLMVELYTLTNIADAIDHLLGKTNRVEAPPTPPVVEEKPKKETHAEIVERITGVDGFNHPELLIIVDEDGEVTKVTKKMLSEGIKADVIESAWASKELRLATDAPGAEAPADTAEDPAESPSPTGNTPEGGE